MKTRVVFLFFVVFTLFLSNGLTGQTKLVSGQSGKEPGKKIAPQTVGVDKQKKNQHAPEQFRNLWKTVDSLADLGQPKTALEIVNTIVIRTKNDNNYPQFLKAILYRIRLNSDFQEDFLNQTITDLHSELQQAGEPVASVLHSILAEVYWKYYQNNAWRLRDRTRSEMMKSDSLATWDLNSLIAAIANEYLLSLANPAVTQAIPIESYTAILEIQKKNDGNSKKTDERKARQDNQTWSLLNPTLFDFLSRRALDFFSSGEQLKNQPSDIFVLDNPGFFSPSSQFINFLSGPVLLPDHCYPADSISKDYFAFRIYQNVAAFHLPDKNPAALIDAELNRLEFMKNKAIGLNADSLYQTALHQLDKDYSTFPYSAEISYQLANWLNTQGQLYHPLESENHRRDIGIAAGICDTAIKRHPATAGAKKCSMLLKSIHEPSLQITCESAVTSEKPFLALLGFKNLNLLYFRIVKADPETFNEKSTGMERKIFYHYLRDLELVKSWSLNLPGENDFQQHNTEIVIPEVPSGFYVLICSQDERFIESELTTYAFTPFWSTRISYVSKHNEYGNLDYFFLDRDTGIPLENIKAEVWTKQYDYNTRKYRTSRLYELISGPQGFISIPAPENNTRGTNLFLKIRNNDDFLITDNFYQHPVTHAPERTYQQTMFYTDRAIYRPGQTIYFKGIILEKTGDKSKIRGGQGTTVNFQDVNSQIVSKLTFTSNDFGSFNGSFTAPLGVLPGQMTISNESGSVSISVEEYKRPSFEVVFLPLEKNYKLGESITLAGKAAAYAGNLIDGASVKYRVVRTARFPYHDWGWYRPGPSSSEVEIKNGVAQTGTDGKFTITFKAIPDLTVDQDSKPVFDYRIYADVTDISGETQSILQTVSVGYQSLLIGIDLPELLNLSGDSLFKITTTNLNGFRTPADIKITLRRLTQPDRTFKPRLWERPDLLSISRSAFYSLFPDDIYGDENNPATWSASDTLFEKTLSTATDSILNIRRLSTRLFSPGSYQLAISTQDPFGEKIQKTLLFTAYDPGSKEVPVQTMNWFVPLKTTGVPGENARFLVGSKEENVNLIFETRRHDSLISREWIRLNKRAVILDVPIREADRGNFTVNFFFIKHNRVFQNSQVINVPYENKKLDILFETFRDKLQPGATETWKIRMSGQGKKGAIAEFLTTMYDASLDVFRPTSWTFDIYSRYFGLSPWDINDAFRTSSGQYFPPQSGSSESFLPSYYNLNWFGLTYFGYSNHAGPYRSGIVKTDMMLVNSSARTMESGIAEAAKPPVSGSIQKTEGSPESQQALVKQSSINIPYVKIRKDFRETAFFYSSLHTDSAGSLSLNFTAPETLTRWKLLGLAHTRNLEYGLVEKELVTQKELMVFPNTPRFVRQGDTVVFSSKISNLSSRDLTGTVNLELRDALTQKPIDSLMNTHHQQWTAALGQSTSVTWQIIIPANSELSVLQCRITASSGIFSDGEEQAIPVLGNRWLVTESLPLPVRGSGTREFRFEKLLNSGPPDKKNSTLNNYRLTLEFASNPAWYAIEALPSLDNKTFENADAVFSSFYSNSLASYIANSNPKIKAVFESWKTLSPDALQSNLVKNQTLKSVLIQETPWVLEAKNETERKQKLGMYFDLNNLSSNLAENLKKLQKLQKPSGGWVWFEGMPENRWISQKIITGMGHLDHLGVNSVKKDADVWKMIVRGIRYLDDELLKDYENQKKYNKRSLDQNNLSATQIQYLYARSYFASDLTPDIRFMTSGNMEAFEYYRKQAEKYWLQNDRYLQGMIALALNRLGDKKIPALILKSLSEKALHSDEMGMYWAQDRGYYWYQAPIEAQALMIEAFDEVIQNEQAVEDLKIWLLKQKQTRNWDNTCATAEACYALLLRGTDLLSSEPGVKISVGKEKINSDKLTDIRKEAGTGYFQCSWSGKEITPDMGNIRISKSGPGVGWGALYWQYFENLDKISPAALPLKLERKLFIERNTSAGPILEPAHQLTNSLTVGDKLVVRIVLTVDRDLEFVHMKDLRASCFEPWFISPQQGPGYGMQNPGSGYRFQNGLGYYQSSTDVATNFFFDYLPKGTHVFEYRLNVSAAGEYSNGITTIQCLYAPEFSAHSDGFRVHVK